MSVIRPKNLPAVTTTTAGDIVILDGATARSILTTDFWLATSSFTQVGTGAVARTLKGKVGERFSVTDFGTLGTANDSATFIAAINACFAAGGGIVRVPVGVFTVRGLTLPDSVTLQGAGKNATYLLTGSVDSAIITISGTKAGIADMALYGKGVNNDTGAFGSSNPTLSVQGVENNIRRVLVLGGQYPIYVTGTDNMFEDVNASNGFGAANVATVGGANWYVRCKFDHSGVGIALTDTAPFTTNWAASTAYTVGQVRIVGGYAIACTVAGTSGGVAPTLKNYQVNMVDGTATWQLVAPVTFSAFWAAAGAGENHLVQCDFSGPYSTGFRMTATTGTNGPAVVVITDSVFSSPIQISNGALVILHGNEFGAGIQVDATYTGRAIIIGNLGFNGAVNVNIAAGVGNFVIADNVWSASTITVAAGASNFYRIANNPNCTVVDGGTGTDKVVQTQNGVTYGSAASIQAPVITLRNASGSTSDIRLGFPSTSGATLTIAGSTSGQQTWKTQAAASGTVTMFTGTDTVVGQNNIQSPHPTNGVGYSTGAGGTVTQATSKATGVTLNTASGQITMNAAALAAATIVSFVLTDSAIAATDVLILNHISGGTPGSYSLNARAAAGSATIDVRNNTAGSLSEAIVVQFALIKAVNA